MPELLNPAPVAHLRHLLRAHSPLVHCMTNDWCRHHRQRSAGRQPYLAGDGDRSPRSARFTAIADALLINVGT